MKPEVHRHCFLHFFLHSALLLAQAAAMPSGPQALVRDTTAAPKQHFKRSTGHIIATTTVLHTDDDKARWWLSPENWTCQIGVGCFSTQ